MAAIAGPMVALVETTFALTTETVHNGPSSRSNKEIITNHPPGVSALPPSLRLSVSGFDDPGQDGAGEAGGQGGQGLWGCPKRDHHSKVSTVAKYRLMFPSLPSRLPSPFPSPSLSPSLFEVHGSLLGITLCQERRCQHPSLLDYVQCGLLLQACCELTI